ncbi:NAD(P)H-binding protein [Pigmentiphaga aceris]|uniref:NAD(P)H-binding protein n=1 Tax=Pigmentiphaga aceris TaxID=1940612 RepID=A0A5C0AWU1_9BURK|nr:NAD(P)H-binding protein [Pigmentiphaga aceris]QEI06236.1 NAD(P)H-binding protein [Pigmentiphaga aceris]
MYVITGATSRTGSQIARHLLQQGKAVRVIGRSAARLQDLVDLGAQAFEADPADAQALVQAFHGADAAWVMLQPNYVLDSPDFRAFQDSIIAALSEALAASSVQHVVALSSWGAGLFRGNGPVAGLHAMEQMLSSHDDLHVMNLRAGYFMENTLPFVDSILSHGAVLSPFNGDLKLPLIATEDVAQAAAEHLLLRDFSGKHVQELHGAEDLSLLEVTKKIGAAIGRPDLPFRQITEAAFAQSLREAGASENIIGLMTEVVAGINSGLIRAEQPRGAQSTGSVHFEDFMRDALLPKLGQSSISPITGKRVLRHQLG